MLPQHFIGVEATLINYIFEKSDGKEAASVQDETI